MINQNDSDEIVDIKFNKLNFKFWGIKLKCMWNITVFFLIALNQVYAALNLPMNIIIIWCIQISPKNIFLV